jgi:hypothetical protein
MPATLVQNVSGALQFSGLTGAGLFLFSGFDALPRTAGVLIHTISYQEHTIGPALTTNVQFWAFKPGGTPTERVTLGDATAAGALIDVNGNARLKLCGHVLERNPGKRDASDPTKGQFWQVRVFTQNKTHDASVTLTYTICDFNESDLRGSPV